MSNKIEITGIKVDDINVRFDCDGELMISGARSGYRSKSEMIAIAEGILALASSMDDEE